MGWKLWLDDQCRDPEAPHRLTPEGYVGFSSAAGALGYIAEEGLPALMDLDHDLGFNNPTGMDFLKVLAERFPDKVPIWNVHSANPVGKANMESFLRSWTNSLLLFGDVSK